MECHWHLSKTHPYWKPLAPGPVKFRACAMDFQQLKKSMIDDAFKILVPRTMLKGKDWDVAWSERDKTLRYENGSFIEFMTYEQDVEAFAGTARHGIWEDEEAPELIHRENMARLISTKGIMMISMTPVRPKLWVVSDVFEKAETDKNIEVWTGATSENPYVDDEDIEFALSQVNDPVERKARLTGEFTWYAGKIYPEYTTRHHCDPFTPPKDWPLIVAIDPHDTKETAASFGFWDLKENLWIMDELWEGGSWRNIADAIKMKCAQYKRAPDSFLIDPSSDRDPKIHETASIFQKFQEIFPNMQKWISQPGSVWAGIQDVKGLLQINPVSDLPKLFVCAQNCPMTDWQLRHYGLKPPTAADQYRYDPKPIKVKDDFCDCVRGIVMYGVPERIRKSGRPMLINDRFGLQTYE